MPDLRVPDHGDQRHLQLVPKADVMSDHWVVTVEPLENEVVEFWRSDPVEGAVLVATKAQHHRNGVVTHDYGPAVRGVEYWTVLVPERTNARRVGP